MGSIWNYEYMPLLNVYTFSRAGQGLGQGERGWDRWLTGGGTESGTQGGTDRGTEGGHRGDRGDRVGQMGMPGGTVQAAQALA